MDGGAWWAAVHGVARSQTRLKRLSSSSNLIFESSTHDLVLVLSHFSRVRLFATLWAV